MLRGSVLDEVFIYGTGTTRRTHLRVPRAAAVTGKRHAMVGRRPRPSTSVGARSNDRLASFFGPTAMAWHIRAQCRVVGP
jgi:hypothetical protein